MSATGARGGVSHVLLPGLDGTGRLFDPFLRAAPPDSGFRVVRYPAHEILERDRLADHVAAAVPAGPYVLIAESYSGLAGLCGMSNSRPCQ